MLDRGAIPDLIPAGAVIATFVVSWLVREDRDGWAFAMTAFAHRGDRCDVLHRPLSDVMVSSTKAANNLTIAERLVVGLLPQGDDDRDGGVPAPGPAVPGLDLLRVPASGDHGRPRRLTRARPRSEALPAGAGCARCLGGRCRPRAPRHRGGPAPRHRVREDRGDRVPRRDAEREHDRLPWRRSCSHAGSSRADSSRWVDVPPFAFSPSSG